jgi:hypothetical protein
LWLATDRHAGLEVSGHRRGGPDPFEKVGVYVLDVSVKRALLLYEGDLQSVPMPSIHGLAPIPHGAPGTGTQDVLIRLSKVEELGWLPGKEGLHYIAE